MRESGLTLVRDLPSAFEEEGFLDVAGLGGVDGECGGHGRGRKLVGREGRCVVVRRKEYIAIRDPLKAQDRRRG